ncbi:ATP-dependent RNA helicase DHX58 [Aplochiton taeniatus]
MADFGLYDYQEEVVQRALQRENTIIWMPTGGGKTRAAVYVAKRHLETTPGGKVAVLVNKVHLVDQHYSKEFRPRLEMDWKVVAVSGDCDEKDFFGCVVKDYHLIICTAQILENALASPEMGKHVELTDFSLLIIDECHHTHKKGVYNKIMRRYLEKKLKGETRLPQVLGLTASPGTGGAKTLPKAVEHVLEICANLDSAIVSSKRCAHKLEARVPTPTKKFDIIDRRPQDPFGDHLKFMMFMIHEYIGSELKLREMGTQEYEADVVELEKTGVSLQDRRMAQCALHLRQYNDALLINDTLRMLDAFCSLEAFYKAKQAFDEIDIFLLGLFQENQGELKTLASNARFENPKMDKLQSTLLEQFQPAKKSKGILFCKTRKSAHCLDDWVRNNPALQTAGIKAAILTGAGNTLSHMTQNEQKGTIQQFRGDTLNLLISTSVAEEGLDIQQCNLVVRYGLLTNEIAQQQATGRARATDSVYSVVATAGSREERREHVNDYLKGLTGRAIAEVQEMTPRDFRKKISELQQEAVLESMLAENKKIKKRSCYDAAQIRLLCRNCFEPVAFANHIKVIDGVHYVNVNKAFKGHYSTGGQVNLGKTFEDWEPGRTVSCAKCSKEWGMEMKYKKFALLPNLAIKNFALDTPEGRVTVKKWKDVKFTVDDFNFTKYCKENYPSFRTCDLE